MESAFENVTHLPLTGEAGEICMGLIHANFVNREDLFLAMGTWRKPCPLLVEDVEQRKSLVRAHVLGEAADPVTAKFKTTKGDRSVVGRFRIGMYAIDRSWRCRWCCIDLDGAGHAVAIREPLTVAGRCVVRARQLGLVPYVEKTRRGYHVWVFFSEPIPAATARDVGLQVADVEAILEDGQVACARSGRGVEVFPKSTRPGRRGSEPPLHGVWCPWWNGAKDGAGRFYAMQEAE